MLLVEDQVAPIHALDVENKLAVCMSLVAVSEPASPTLHVQPTRDTWLDRSRARDHPDSGDLDRRQHLNHKKRPVSVTPLQSMDLRGQNEDGPDPKEWVSFPSDLLCAPGLHLLVDRSAEFCLKVARRLRAIWEQLTNSSGGIQRIAQSMQSPLADRPDVVSG
jgi:hypothetical protein